jgi:cyclic-di-GMP-binding protein
MKLNIPEQIEPGKDDFPSHPRKLKKWLTSLKQANMGAFTREIYNGLLKLNRLAVAPKQRLEDMEMMTEHARHIFDQLHKHFINRTLPLPDKSLKIINLNQAILTEMSIGYKIIIFEASNNLNKVDNKTLLLACERALHYKSEMLLRSSQVYTELPAGSWSDIHRIYTYAKSKDLQKKKVKNHEIIKDSISIEDHYKQILLFSLARPHALRQSDSDRVYRAMPDWADYTSLSSEPIPNKMNRYFVSHIDGDQPPNCISNEDLKDLGRVCAIDTMKLINHLRSQINDDESLSNSITVGDQVSQDTLRTIVSSLSLCAKRRFSRGERADDIKVAIGLSTIYDAINEEVMPPKPMRGKKAPSSTFSLESIPDSERADTDVFAKQDPSLFITNPDLADKKDSAAGAWDMVSKGRALTESYARELQQQDQALGELNTGDPDAHWKISNVSAGGYCLRWVAATTSKAQVGELIGVREREPDHTYQWRVGVIRWMQYTVEHGLEIGVQILSPKVISCTIRRPERKKEAPFNCLMLPGIKPIQQPSTLLLPAHAFQKNNTLEIHVHERDLEIKLGTIREHTGSFTQFQFSHANEDGNPDDEGNEDNSKKSSNPHDFDSIWSSL